jgi:hypothetical protein
MERKTRKQVVLKTYERSVTGAITATLKALEQDCTYEQKQGHSNNKNKTKTNQTVEKKSAYI